MKNTYIITGASRGIGKEIALHLADENMALHLLARSNMDELKSKLQAKGAEVWTWKADLSKPETLSGLMQDIFAGISKDTKGQIVLVNNAGMLEPMGKIGKHKAEDYLANLQVNFTSAVLLCHLFIQHINGWTSNKRIMNISSGAAKKPYPGWGHYCSTKAGLNMFTSCIHEEQKSEKHPVAAAAYNPGRTDTKMQEEIRGVSTVDFPFAQSFIDAWKDGVLNDPVKVAAHIVEIMRSERYPAGEIISYQ